MPQNDIDSQIRTLVEQFVDELTELVRQAALEAVGEALAASGVPTTAAPRRRKKATRSTVGRKKAARKKTATGRRARRSAEDLEAQAAAVLTYVQKNQGQRLEEIAAGMGEDSADLKRPIQGLLSDGKLRTEGQKRGTRYFAGRGAGGRKKAARKKVTRKRAAKKKAARKVGKKKAARRKQARRKSKSKRAKA